jgi:hypothetical protein
MMQVKSKVDFSIFVRDQMNNRMWNKTRDKIHNHVFSHVFRPVFNQVHMNLERSWPFALLRERLVHEPVQGRSTLQRGSNHKMIFHVIIMECAAYSYDEFGPFASKEMAEKEIAVRYPDIEDDDEKYASIIQIDLSKLVTEHSLDGSPERSIK